MVRPDPVFGPVMASAPAELTAAAAARHLYEAWSATRGAKVITETYMDGLLDEATPTVEPEGGSLYDLTDVEARRQVVAADLTKKSPDFADIVGLELADLLGVTPGDAGDRIHLCAIDEDATAEWLQEELSQGEGDGSELLEKVLSPTRRKQLRRYLNKIEEGEDVGEFSVTPRELKKLAPLRAQMRLEEGEIDKACFTTTSSLRTAPSSSSPSTSAKTAKSKAASPPPTTAVANRTPKSSSGNSTLHNGV